MSSPIISRRIETSLPLERPESPKTSDRAPHTRNRGKAECSKRTNLALVVVLWLFVTAVGFGAGTGAGLAFLIVGAALIAGEVWIEWSAGRHATFVVLWRLAWRIGVGAWLIVAGAVNSDGWAAALPAVFGAWLIFWGLAVATFCWLEMRGEAADSDV